MKKNLKIFLLFVLLASIALWLYKKDSSTTLKTELKDFAVSDTASIDKIFLADRKGNTALLEKKAPGFWMVNGKYEARNTAINTLLYTIKALEVRSPVGKNMYNNAMKLMASSSVKTEIYQQGKLIKTYYVGHPTMDNQGTFMYLNGSSVPFIMHIPGFNGYLTSRYFASEAEWKDHGLFRYDPKRIVQVKVEDFARPYRSFDLRRNQDSSYSVILLQSNQQLKPLDPLKLRTFLTGFQATNYEREDYHLSKFQHDSIKEVGPFARVSVMDDAGKNNAINLYRIPVTVYSKSPVDVETGIQHPYDMDKFSVQIIGDTTWYLCQYFHFDRVLKDPQNLMPGPDKTAPQKRD